MLPSLTLARGQGKLPGFSGGRQHNGNTICPLGVQILSVAKASAAPLHLDGTTTRYHNKAVFALDAYCLYTKDCIAVPFESTVLRWIVAHPQCFCRYRGMYLSGETKNPASLGYLFACMPSVDWINIVVLRKPKSINYHLELLPCRDAYLVSRPLHTGHLLHV